MAETKVPIEQTSKNNEPAQRLVSSSRRAIADTTAERQEQKHEKKLGQPSKKQQELLSQIQEASKQPLDKQEVESLQALTVSDTTAAEHKETLLDNATPTSSTSGRRDAEQIVQGTSGHDSGDNSSTESRNAKKSRTSCAICYEEINLPYTLNPCGHTACKGCLKEWFETSERSGAVALSCPVCRADVDQEEAMRVMGRPFQAAGSLSSGELHGDLDDELTEEWLAESAKRCQNCGSWIIKDNGCDLMQCLCGYRFCWQCGSPGGRDCGCSPSNHMFWDNILNENANETSCIAAPNQLSNFRAFILTTKCINMLRSLLELQNLETKCKDILQTLLRSHEYEYGWVFSDPVDPLELPDYYDLIKSPMDLGTIQRRLDCGRYRSVFKFRRHVHRTFDNAMLYYNKQGSAKLHNLAKEMKSKFDTDFERLIQPDDMSDKLALYESSLNGCFANDESKYIRFYHLLKVYRRGRMKMEYIQRGMTKLFQGDTDLQREIMSLLLQCIEVSTNNICDDFLSLIQCKWPDPINIPSMALTTLTRYYQRNPECACKGYSPGSSGGQELGMAETYIYLESIMHEVPSLFGEYCNILLDFNHGEMDIEDVVLRVSQLFDGNEKLILGFNEFVPTAYKIITTSTSQQKPNFREPSLSYKDVISRKDVLSYTRKDIISFVRSIEQHFSNQNERKYFYFLDAIHKHKQRGKRIEQVYQQVATLFQWHPTLQRKFNSFFPDFMLQTLPQLAKTMQPVAYLPPPASPSHQQLRGQELALVELKQLLDGDEFAKYLAAVKKRFTSKPQIYEKFVGIIDNCQQEKRSITQVLYDVTVVFADSLDLVQKFISFLPSTVQAEAKAYISQAEQGAMKSRLVIKQTAQGMERLMQGMWRGTATAPSSSSGPLPSSGPSSSFSGPPHCGAARATDGAVGWENHSS